MEKPIVVMTTCESQPEAERISRTLLEKRLAACIQVTSGIRSFYWWEGAVADAPELLIVIKTRQSLYAEVEAALRGVHPYEVPEIIAVDIAEISADYRRWLMAETKADGDR